MVSNLQEDHNQNLASCKLARVKARHTLVMLESEEESIISKWHHIRVIKAEVVAKDSMVITIRYSTMPQQKKTNSGTNNENIMNKFQA